MRVLRTAERNELDQLMTTLCALLSNLGTEFAIFAPPIIAELKELGVSHALFDRIVAPIPHAAPAWLFESPKREAVCAPVPHGVHDGTVAQEHWRASGNYSVGQQAALRCAATALKSEADDVRPQPRKCNLAHVEPEEQKSLRSAWEARNWNSTRADWHEWMRKLTVELLRESPSLALRACAPLAQAYQPLARGLFNAAFLSKWNILDNQGQESLIIALEKALDAEHMSLEVLQPLLNLAEFMELVDKALPINIRKLGALAEKCHAYAKALHYREVEFHTSPAETIESLISINNHLQQPEAAKGILTYAWQHYQVELKESWYEKLQRWTDARSAYERKQKEDPNNLAWTIGRMRCHHALGDWETLASLARETWSSEPLTHDPGSCAEVARLAAAAAWSLRNWGEMGCYCTSMPNDTVEKSLFGAVLTVHAGHFNTAQTHINQARRQLDSKFTALVGESYHRAYRNMISLLQLCELEEIIQHRKHETAMPLDLLVRMWQHRIGQVQCDADVWQEILAVRYLVVPPAQDPRTWLTFCSLCRKSDRSALSRKLLVELLGVDPACEPTFDLSLAEPAVAFAYLKQLWDDGRRHEALTRMRHFVQAPRSVQDARLAAKSWLKLGQWQRALLDTDSIQVVLQSLAHATELNPESYKAWHVWAMINFEAVSQYSGAKYVVPAIKGFVRSIALGRERALQDTLRLLTMWFKYGSSQAVDEAVQRGFVTIPIDTWLLVTPQIIARIHSPTTLVRQSVHLLLNRVAKAHPQGLIYPLTVASKSLSEARQSAALRVLQEMRRQGDRLVEQAALVSVELIRTSILWHEMWHSAFEAASRLYFGTRDVEGMLATLQPLHEMLQHGADTMREASFLQAFGVELDRAHNHCQRYRQFPARSEQACTEVHAAWDIYYNVFRRITKQISKLGVLELQHVSPKLLEAKDLELAVPGTYLASKPVVRIRSFAPSMSVIASKQRPRKINISGSDGNDHAFLLKGHEDLRQDERVMQLFGLVNTLLSTDRDTSKKDLLIQRYSVVPLSPNSGLISWVAQCDTLHALVKEYREARKTLLNIEHRLMLQMAPDYDLLPVLNKLEVFEETLASTTGHDLASLLWLRSRNAEHWLLRRTTYTRSLAVMSMVGYILGLGDRHPSNLMLDRLTGKILHIDFGDCFEVAVHREKFPEKIPFRLTRMLVNAMEISGIEGNFRSSCEAVMGMLRNNKDSVLAMLEAFVHDPLINWRLLIRPSQEEPDHRSRSACSRVWRAPTELRSRAVSDAVSKPRPTCEMPSGLPSRSTSMSGLPEHMLENSLFTRMASLPMQSGERIASQPAMRETSQEEWQHPASVIGTPQFDDRVPSDLPESASVTVFRRCRSTLLHQPELQDEAVLNDRAVSVLRRVKSKLAGSDFPDQAVKLDVATQVNRLVVEAQSELNLCQLYVGYDARSQILASG